MAAGEDDFRFGAPDEWLCLDPIMLGHEAVDCRLQIDDRMKDAMLQASASKLGNETLDGFQP